MDWIKSKFLVTKEGTSTLQCCTIATLPPQNGLLAQSEVKLRWQVLADRMYTAAPTGKSREQLYALLFNKAARGNHTNPYEEKAHRGPALKAVQAWWEQCKDWMLYFKGQSSPSVLDIQGLLQAFRSKEAFFLLAAAWVNPGRNALQSAEQRC